MSGRRTQSAPCPPTFPSFPDSAFMEVGSALMMTVDFPSPRPRSVFLIAPRFCTLPIHCLRGRFSSRCPDVSHAHRAIREPSCLTAAGGSPSCRVLKISDTPVSTQAPLRREGSPSTQYRHLGVHSSVASMIGGATIILLLIVLQPPRFRKIQPQAPTAPSDEHWRATTCFNSIL